MRFPSVIAALFLSVAVHAQGAPTEGIDYVELKPPQPTDSAGKIEVLEFFWYRCPHCYALEPDLEAWLKQLPRDAQFRRVPGILNEEWAIDGRIFYALEAMGQVGRLHRPLFDAIHQEGGARLHGDAYAKWVADWLAKHGVDMAKYDATLHSFTVESKLRRAMQMSQAYRLDGVPSLAVQGRFVVMASGSRQGMLATTSYLIGEARKQAAKSRP
jgi:thiol:disulfide interchange protein DsbA